MNGQHFLHYRYRLPLSRVDTLGIFGDILVKAIGFLNINVSSFGAKAWVTVAAIFPCAWTGPGPLPASNKPCHTRYSHGRGAPLRCRI